MISNRFSSLLAKEDGKEMIDKDFSNIVIGNSKDKKKEKENKKKKIPKSQDEYKISKTTRGKELRNNHKKDFTKKKE